MNDQKRHNVGHAYVLMYNTYLGFPMTEYGLYSAYCRSFLYAMCTICFSTYIVCVLLSITFYTAYCVWYMRAVLPPVFSVNKFT